GESGGCGRGRPRVAAVEGREPGQQSPGDLASRPLTGENTPERGRPPRGERGPSTLRPRGGWTVTPALNPEGERWPPVCILGSTRSKQAFTGQDAAMAPHRGGTPSTAVATPANRACTCSRLVGASPPRPVHQWTACAWVPGGHRRRPAWGPVSSPLYSCP